MSFYRTISENIHIEIEPIKKSRFIAYAFYIENEQEVFDHIDNIKATYSDANHHCWAYALTKYNKFRFNDDGEPSGSAGKPILSHIQGANLSNVLVIVVRYFGGTKLGVGGLIRAYGQAAKEVLNIANIIDMMSSCYIRIIYDYNETAHIETVLKHYNAVILSQEYFDTVMLNIQINDSDKLNFIEEINNLTKGKVRLNFLSK